jgi:hypothetical protein
MKITKAGFKALRSASCHNKIMTPITNDGRGKSNWLRMMKRLEAAGYVEDNSNLLFPFRLTEKGGKLIDREVQ